MWTKLIVKNFKSIGEKGIDLELKPLTLLVGPNGSGKSSILQSIAVMSANVGQSEFLIGGELVQFYAFEEVAHKHEIDRWMTLEIHDSEDNGVRLEYKHDSGEQKETVIYKDNDYIQMSLEGDRKKGLVLTFGISGEKHNVSNPNPFTKLSSSILSGLSINPNHPFTAYLQDKVSKILDSIGSNLKEKVFLLSSLRGKIPSMGLGEQTAAQRWWFLT